MLLSSVPGATTCIAANLVRKDVLNSQSCPFLQVLSADVVRLSGFVCVRGIKHLVLMVPHPHFGHLSSALSGLEQLKTLRLADATGGDKAPPRSGALQLLAHRSLRSLSLRNAVPESISCNDSCEVHVELEVGRSTQHPVWDTVLTSLRSVTLYGRSPALEALPSILLNASNLTRARVAVTQWGTATAPLLLGGALAHVEELVLRNLELHAIVPAHVSWRNVYMAATHLNLRFEAVATFGEAIPAFCFRYNNLQVCYPQPRLYSLMAVTVSLHPNLLWLCSQGFSAVRVGCCRGQEASRVDWTPGR